ncbi:IPExxxVDY family protein [Eudoraea chungangensis]|uniref:IPExxxVDY family protein n=1 Tax=Eudoraea chungangensis TaxID=1481905 RepID=UPI0023EDA63B|nr:IPExxxVDY family protein [Eudoraea chungangensis]
MITTLKFSDEFYEEDFSLFAIHSDLEDYALAYSLNLMLDIRLKRSLIDIDISGQSSFPCYEWKDAINERNWSLIVNTSIKEENLRRDDLFSNEETSTVYHLMPEFKDVDYFLKIEQEGEDLDEWLMESLLKISKVITAYPIEVSTIKSKQNLIL